MRQAGPLMKITVSEDRCWGQVVLSGLGLQKLAELAVCKTLAKPAQSGRASPIHAIRAAEIKLRSTACPYANAYGRLEHLARRAARATA